MSRRSGFLAQKDHFAEDLPAVIDYATDHDSGAKGCFLVSCVSTSVGTVEDTGTLLKEAIANTDKRIQALFMQEVARGTLPKDFSVKQRAMMLFDLRQGLVFRARAGFGEADLRHDIDRNVAAVLADV